MAKAEEEKGLTAGVGDSILRFYRETLGELRKVVWPTPQEALRLTGIVLAVIVSTSLILGLADWVYSKIFEFLLQLGG